MEYLNYVSVSPTWKRHLKDSARAFIIFAVALGMLMSMPVQSPDVEAARIVMTFDDGTESKIVEFTSDPLPGERATVYLKLRGDVTVTQAAMNASAVLLEQSWQVGATGLAGLAIGIDISGDLNGDGYTELIVTAPATGGAQGFIAGLVGRSTGYQIPPQDIGIQGTTANDWLGYGLSTGADLNKDGYDDMVTSRLEIDPSTPAATGTGDVLIFWGGSRLINTTPDLILTTGSNGDMFGFSVSTDGDLNGDGNPDLAGGAPRNILNTNNPGRAHVFYGNGNTSMPSAPNQTVTGTDNGDGFGTVVHICGDVNGDGYDDLLVGAPGHNSTSDFDVGKIYVYHGSSSGIGTTADWTYEGENEEDLLGFSATGIGDANGDGYGDIVVGVPLWDDGSTADVGQALVFYGSSSGLSTTPDVTIEGSTGNGALGADVAHAGDINDDGLGDFVIGAPNTNNGSMTDSGSTQVHFGNENGVNATPAKVLYGWEADGDMGISVGPGGDGNGDGYDDIIVGDTTLQFTYVYYGGPDAKDPKLYVDDTEIWSYHGSYPGTARTDDFADQLNAYIQSHQDDVDVNGDLMVPINVSMSAKGKLKLDDVVVQFFRLVKPTGLQAAPVPSGGALKLTWDDHTIKQDDISKMAIEMWNGTGWEEIEKVAKNAKEYIVTGLTDGVQYEFRIRAFDGAVQAYSEASDTASAIPSDTKAPGKVLNVMVLEDRDVMGVNISWDPSDEDTVNYEIWSNKTGAWEVLINVTGNMSYYVDTDVEDGPWYWYKVRGWDEVPLIGEFSAIARGRLLDLTGPAIPTNFRASTVPTGRALRLTWDLNTDDTVAYSLESNKTGPWKEVALLPRSVSEYVDTGLSDGTTYWYRLAARDESDNPSNYTGKISATPVDSTPPAAPSGLEVAARPAGEALRLSWDLSTDDTTQYNVYMYDPGEGDFVMVAQVLVIYDQYDVSSLVNGESYRFRIKGQDAAGLESEWSNEVTGIPVDTFPPAIPGGIEFKLDPNGGAVNLSWEPNTDDTVAYRVLIWNGPLSRWDMVDEVDHPQTYYAVEDLNNNEPYAFVVRAVDEGGTESPNSQRVDVIPKDTTAPPAPEFIGLPAVTNSKDLTVSGTCQPGATIALIINNLRQDETALCDEGGAFSIIVRLKNGPNDIIAEALDDSGLTTSSSRFTVRVDVEAPTVLSTEPADGTRDVTRYNLTYLVYFSEDVKDTSIKSIVRKDRVELAQMLTYAQSGAADNIVPRLVSYDRVRYRATFEIDDVLVGDSAYTILIYDIEDAAGNTLELNGHTIQLFTVEGGGGDGGDGGGDEGIGSLAWIIAAVVIIILVVVVAFLLVSRSGTHEEIEVDRSVFEGPSFDDEPTPQRPDIQEMYSEAYTERDDEDTEHHDVEGGLGDWLAEQERKSQEADEETKRLVEEMQSTTPPPEDTGPIEEVPPDMLPESEYTAAYHIDAPAEEAPESEEPVEKADEEADEETSEEADEEADEEPTEEDDAVALLDELEEELESEKED